MTTTINRVITLAIVAGLVLFAMVMNSRMVSGSVNDSSASYQSTTTRTAVLGAALASPTTLSLGFGTLGSVIITGASGANTGIINLYDATSTVQHSDYATTTLASFPAQAAAGTYVFDVEYKRGLVVEIIGTVGTSTITWKK